MLKAVEPLIRADERVVPRGIAGPQDGRAGRSERGEPPIMVPYVLADGTDEQLSELYESSKRILTEAGYYGAGTCEFLVAQDGTISFLEVNTRLQVEHCVSEEVTGIDLVREQFRIADGETLGYDDPEPHAHSIEFRINGEDAGRNFLPQPGAVTSWAPPSGPGVRLDDTFDFLNTLSYDDGSTQERLVTPADAVRFGHAGRHAPDNGEVGWPPGC